MSSEGSQFGIYAVSLCTLLFGGLMLCPVAARADESPPHIDLSQPHPQPPYPGSALADGEHGTVLVALYVRPNGRIAKYRVARSSGFGDLDDAAVEGVLNWRFVPAVRDGEPVSDWTTVKVVFELPQPPVLPPPKVPK